MTGFARNEAVLDDLSVLRNAINYRNWVFSLIRPYLGHRVLELGSGIGIYSKLLLDRERVWFTDYDRDYINYLRESYEDHPNVSCDELDLANLDETKLAQMREEKLDTILAMNVLEHIRDDANSIRILATYLTRRGRIVLIVPALSFLFGSLDLAYGHHRRYDDLDVERLLFSSGLRLKRVRYFNLAAIAGWFWVSKIRRSERLPKATVQRYDRIVVPLMAKLEAAIPPPIGNSMLIVLER